MATRCNIRHYKNGQLVNQYYRHWDGYPDGAGREIVNAFEGFKHGDSVAERIGKVGGTELEGKDVALHGDIEYFYKIDESDVAVEITFYESCEDYDSGEYYHRPIESRIIYAYEEPSLYKLVKQKKADDFKEKYLEL